MKLKKTVTTLKLPARLVEKAKEAYATKNVSKAVCSALEDSLLLPDAFKMPTSYALHQLMEIEERSTLQQISVRIDEKLNNFLKKFDSDENFENFENFQNVAAMLIAQILYTPLEEVDFTNYTHLLSILGSKWDKRMIEAVQHIRDTCGIRWNTSVETCAGALGIHANISFADKTILNDDDQEKIRLYKILQQQHKQLMLLMRNFDVSHEAFGLLMTDDPAQKTDLELAAKYLYLNLTSYRREGSTFLNTMTDKNFHKKLTAIYPTHRCLKDTAILEQDLFKVIEKYRKQPNTIFIVDPPYLGTNVYKRRIVSHETAHGKNFDLPEHKRLAKLLESVKKKNGNDFIYFCRITVTRKKNKKNKLILTEEELKQGDKDLLGTIDDLYFGKGFYYVDVELDYGTTERIITSFPFDGSKKYGKAGM